MTNEIDAIKLSRIFGDRVLIKRKGNPEKKRGIYVPMSAATKKEPKKIWWGELVAFGEESIAQTDHHLQVGDTVGVEPIGNHYASWKGADGFDYCWVPDEHLALADDGSVADYYADRLDRGAAPQLRVLGRRVLARPVADDDKVNGIHRIHQGERDARLADVLRIGPEKDETDRIPVGAGDRILHVDADAGSSAQVDIFEPALLVLRVEDLIAECAKTPKTAEEPTHA